MAPGSQPSDVYNPTASVAPTTGMPNDYLGVQANPTQMGANVGEALQKTGQSLEEAGNKSMELAIIRQGQFNETAAETADQQYAIEAGKIFGDYKALKGNAAVVGATEASNRMAQLRTQYRANLPNDPARRTFDQLSIRNMTTRINDIDAYAADQQKQGFRDAKAASMDLAKNELANPQTAFDESRVGYQVGVFKSSLAAIMQVDYGNLMKADPNHPGEIIWDNSVEGQNAKAVYEQQLNKGLEEAEEARLTTVATDPEKGNYNLAMQYLEQDKKEGWLPAVAYAHLANKFSPAYRANEARTLGGHAMSLQEGRYADYIHDAVNGKYDVKTQQDMLHFLESSGRTDSGIPTSNTGNVGPLQIGEPLWQDAIKYGFVKPGMNIHNPNDNLAVGNLLIQRYTQMYHNDPEKLAVAWSSGASNVDESPNAPHAWKNDEAVVKDKEGNVVQTVSQYVAKGVDYLRGKHQLGASDGPMFMSRRDFMEQDQQNFNQDLKNLSEERFPGDANFSDSAYTYGHKYQNDYFTAANHSDVYNRDVIYKWMLNSHETDLANQIKTADAKTQDSYNQLSPLDLQRFRAVELANSRGVAKGYGTDFYKLMGGIITGTISDPMSLTGNLNTISWAHGKRDVELTTQGLDELMKIKMDGDQTFWQQTIGYLNKERQIITQGGTGTRAQEHWQQAVETIMGKILNARDAGLKAKNIFDPKNVDYVGGDLPALTISSEDLYKDQLQTQEAAFSAGIQKQQQQPQGKSSNWSILDQPWMFGGVFGKAGQQQQPQQQQQQKFDPGSIKTKDELIQAVKDKKLSDQQIIEIGKRLGLVK